MSAGTGCRSTSKPRPSSSAAVRSACGAQSPGGLSDGTFTSSARNRVCASRCTREIVLDRAGGGEGIERDFQAEGLNASMNRRKIRADSPASSGVIASSGLWLMPALQRTNSMPMSTRSTSAMPSCPAPEGSRRTGRPSAAIALRRSAPGATAAHNAVLPSCVGRMSTFTSRRAQIDAMASLTSTVAPAPLLVRRRAEVDREPRLPGITLVAPGAASSASHGADKVGFACAARFDRQHAFGRGRERIAAQRHRHRPRMPGHAFDLDREAVGAVDGGHHAHRQALGLEHRALLDMQLGVGEHVGALPRGVADALGIESERRQCVAHRHSIAVAAVEELPIERAGDRAAAEQRGAETHAFLVGESHDLDRERQPRPARVEGVNAIDGRDHAQHAVVLAGVAHGVEVRTQHEAGRARRTAFVATDDIADRIESRRSFPPRASSQA